MRSRQLYLFLCNDGPTRPSRVLLHHQTSPCFLRVTGLISLNDKDLWHHRGRGGGGEFCDSVWQGGGGSKSDQICVTSFLNGPIPRSWNLFCKIMQASAKPCRVFSWFFFLFFFSYCFSCLHQPNLRSPNYVMIMPVQDWSLSAWREYLVFRCITWVLFWLFWYFQAIWELNL